MPELLEEVPRSGKQYLLAGGKWSLSEHEQLLACPFEGLELALEVWFGKIQWQWSWNVGGRGWLRHCGEEQSLQDAAFCAAAFVPASMTQHWRGLRIISWFSVNPGQWMAVIDCDQAKVIDLRAEPTEFRRFRWERNYAPAEKILALVQGRQLVGYAPDLESALAACVTAPQLFEEACAEHVAQRGVV